jgi:hypothetical protein
MTTFTAAHRSALRTVLAPAMKSMRFGKGKSGRGFVETELNLPKGTLRLAVGSKIFEVSVTPLMLARHDGNVFFKIVRTA